jgi:hypothetical protein
MQSFHFLDPKALPCWPSSLTGSTCLDGFHHQIWQIYWVAPQAFLSLPSSWALILHGPSGECSKYLWLHPSHPHDWTLPCPPMSWGWRLSVHCDESFGVDSKLVIHLHLENLYHHKQLAKLRVKGSINNFSFNVSIGYNLSHRNGEACPRIWKCKQ